MTQVSKHLEHTDKVTLIGVTNKPWDCNLKEVTKFFYKKFYFPYPDHATRSLIFKHLVESNGVKLTDAFKTSLFASITEGVTPGSMARALQVILSKRRKLDINLRPLTVDDFVVPLAENYTCFADEYELFKEFTHSVTGIKERQAALLDPQDDKKKKKK